jgi:hypothetical protein
MQLCPDSQPIPSDVTAAEAAELANTEVHCRAWIFPAHILKGGIGEISPGVEAIEVNKVTRRWHCLVCFKSNDREII